MRTMFFALLASLIFLGGCRSLCMSDPSACGSFGEVAYGTMDRAWAVRRTSNPQATVGCTFLANVTENLAGTEDAKVLPWTRGYEPKDLLVFQGRGTSELYACGQPTTVTPPPGRSPGPPPNPRPGPPDARKTP